MSRDIKEKTGRIEITNEYAKKTHLALSSNNNCKQCRGTGYLGVDVATKDFFLCPCTRKNLLAEQRARKFQKNVKSIAG